MNLTANPESGWEFDQWTGSLTGSTNPVNVLMDSDKTVGEIFSEILVDRVISYSKVSDANGTYDIWTTCTDPVVGAWPVNITNSTGLHEYTPRWSSDGSKIAFKGTGDIWVMNADGTDAVQLTTTGTAERPAWNGDYILYWDDDPATNRYQIFSVSSAAGTPTRVTELLNSQNPGNIDVSSDGTIAFAIKNGIWTMSQAGNPIDITQTVNTIDNGSPAWSPDGTKIAFASDREGLGKFDIYIMNADGSNVTAITDTADGYSDTTPDWSPDGSQIVYSSNGMLRIMNADGTGDKSVTAGITPHWR